MDEPVLPASARKLVNRLLKLGAARHQQHEESRAAPSRRKALSTGARRNVLDKTGRRCHICGGLIEERWQADHVLAHSGGGQHSAENYLPAHRLCNNYRWDYLPEEFQWILKIGVWAHGQMKNGGTLGSAMLERFFVYEVNRQQRRRVG